MRGTDLLRELRALGIRLSLDGDRLRINAPKGAMTEHLQEQIREHRTELLKLLQATETSVEELVFPSVPRDQPLPLSSFQRRIWVLHRLDPDSTAYNLVAWKTWSGSLDVEALRSSLSILVRRHEILRTNFRAEEGNPRLVIHPPSPVDLQVLDWTEEGPENLDQRISDLGEEEVRKPMALGKGPLFRPVAVRTADDSFVILLTVHHIATDGWSLALILSELQAIYGAEAAGFPVDIPDPPLQYADYSVWQNDMLGGSQAEREESFWLEYLEGAPTVLSLPSDRPRGTTQSFDGGILAFSIEQEVGQKLKALCQSESVTPFMVWLATFGLLLSRYTGQQDLLIGSPVASRTTPLLETMLGPFVNTLVFRHQQKPEETGRELLARARKNTLAAHSHQSLPFERLVELIPSERTMAHSPLFQVSCAYHNQPGRSDFHVSAGGSMFDLTLNGFEVGDQHGGSLEFNLSLFDRSTVERMAFHFQTLLRSLVDHPDTPLYQLPMVFDEEARLLVESWNDTNQDLGLENTLVEAWEKQATINPQRPAITFGEDTLSYEELKERVDRLASQLKIDGIEAGATVAVFLDRGPELVSAPLAIMKAGGTYLPLDPEYPKARIEFILEDSGAEFVLTDSSLVEKLSNLGVRTILVDSPNGQGGSEASLPHPPAVDDLAYVIYTSGSTGKPKGVEVTHGGLMNILAAFRTEPGLEAEDSILAVTTFAFDISAMELFLPLIVGARVVIAPTEVAEHGRKLLALMEAEKPTVMQATPATWQMLLEAGWDSESTDQGMQVWSGGEMLPRPLADTLLERSDSVWNLYGPTETTIWSTTSRVQKGTGPVSIGRPLPNTRVYVLDRSGAPAPIGLPGELFIGGKGVARGYRNLPELTQERFLPDPMDPSEDGMLYRTGDLVRWKANQTLEFLGRMDQQVKVRGHRIELGEIESVLLSHPKIQSAAASVRDARIVAYVVFVEEQNETSSGIRRFLRDHLPEYMIPSFVVTLPQLPMTENRKIDRGRLPSPTPGTAAAQARQFEAPAEGQERAIAAIWEKLLGAGIQAGANDNFFELGGHSLLALQALYQIEQLKGKSLDPRAIFFENLRQIAAR